MKKIFLGLMIVVLLIGCSGMSNTQQRVLSGGAMGASGGTLIGWAAGCPACGAAIGGAAGAAGGLVYDSYQKSRGRP